MKHLFCSRREFVQRTSHMVGVFCATLLVACNTKKTTLKETVLDPCEDLSGLQEADLKTREGLAYVSETPVFEEQCDNCNLWLPPSGTKKCGKCTLIKGPIYPGGYCTNWTPQV